MEFLVSAVFYFTTSSKCTTPDRMDGDAVVPLGALSGPNGPRDTSSSHVNPSKKETDDWGRLDGDALRATLTETEKGAGTKKFRRVNSFRPKYA
jgi:hypothetical protein